MEVISTRRYEARPAADSHASMAVEPTEAVASVKEEEWETRKKKEITTTRQIETRVKRQVVLEDGQVVVDSGPQVTTNTTEDVEQQEHTTQERRTTGEQPQSVDWPAKAKAGSALVHKQLNQTIVKSREEIEETLETEDRQQLGDMSDEAYLQAVRNNRGDLRLALAESKRQQQQQQQTGPRVLQHKSRSNKVVDTEKTLERSELKQDGQIVTERKTTVEHEEIKDDEAPEEIEAAGLDEAHEVRKEASQRYAKRRDEDIVDYVSNGERVAREMRYVSETTEAERSGDWPKHEKQNNRIRSKSPPEYIMESTREASRSNGHHPRASPSSSEHLQQQRSSSIGNNVRNYEVSTRRQQEQRHTPPHDRPKVDPPSPPLRRKAKEQVITTKVDRSYHQESLPARATSLERAASPVHVVQRTWESRSRDERDHQQRRERHLAKNTSQSSTRHRPHSPVSRSVSPSPVRSSPARRDDKDKRSSRPSKSPSPSKYKIGESFRKLVGKLRSASSERKSAKRAPPSSSTSQLTQTDDGSYIQYNSVDRNIPLGPAFERDNEERAPERPPRSPRNTSSTQLINVRQSPNMIRSSSSKLRSSSSPRHHEYKESFVATSHQKSDQPIHRYYLGEDPYGAGIYGKEKGYTRLHSSKQRSRPIDQIDYSLDSSSLGRFSKSTGRLVNELQGEYSKAREAQTLPRKMHNQSSLSSSRTATTSTRRTTNGSSPLGTHYLGANNAIDANGHEPSKHYGSMINISFRNQVSPPKTTHLVQTSVSSSSPTQGDKTYKSTLSRSKSFNVEIADDGLVSTPSTPSRPLNKLVDQSAPLKSPAILASINRNNNRAKLFTNGSLHDH